MEIPATEFCHGIIRQFFLRSTHGDPMKITIYHMRFREKKRRYTGEREREREREKDTENIFKYILQFTFIDILSIIIKL